MTTNETPAHNETETSTEDRAEAIAYPTTFVGAHQVVSLSSAQETFAMVIESAEYAQMQSNFFDVLWGVSNDADIDDSGRP